MSHLPRSADERTLRAFLDLVRSELEKRAPARFVCRFGPPHADCVSGLVVQRDGVPGYAFVNAVSHWAGGCQGGVIREGARVEYSASYHTQGPWPKGDRTTWQLAQESYLEGWSSPDAGAIADKILEWFFPPPREEPPPVGGEERERLAAVARGRRRRVTEEARRQALALRHQGRLVDACRAVGLELGFDFSQPDVSLTPAGRVVLHEDLRHLLPDRLVWNFPSQDDGRLPLGETVILATYEAAAPLGKGRELCLAAVAPQRRRDGSAIRLELSSLIPVNHKHRWDAAPWLWDDRAVGAGEECRWGVAGLPLALLAPEKRSENLRRLQEVCKGESGTAGERAALAILLQDEGRFDQALQLFDVQVGPFLWKVIGGEKVRLPSCHPPLQPTWVSLCRQALRRCAPWLVRPTVTAATQGQESWTKSDRGRRRRVPTFRLFALPGQHHIHKVTLMLQATDRDLREIQFELDGCGSNARLPDERWQRPIEIDLLRYGIREELLV